MGCAVEEEDSWMESPLLARVTVGILADVARKRQLPASGRRLERATEKGRIVIFDLYEKYRGSQKYSKSHM